MDYSCLDIQAACIPFTSFKVDGCDAVGLPTKTYIGAIAMRFKAQASESKAGKTRSPDDVSFILQHRSLKCYKRYPELYSL